MATFPLADSASSSSPSDLAADQAGNLYLADAVEQRLRAFDSAGRVVAERFLGGVGSPWRPTSFALGPASRLAVADAERDEIQVLAIDRGAGP